MKPREAAYLALLASLRGEDFIAHTLEQWQRQSKPSALDFSFAYEIAAGSARMALALDYMAAQLSTHQKLSLKLKERALLRTALYQHCFMGKVPLYAIVNETIELAKKYCHRTFANYLNALLRQLEKGVPELPAGNSVAELSIRYSYPEYFVKALIADYGLDTSIAVLKEGNKPPRTMLRLRPGASPPASSRHLGPLTLAPLALIPLADETLPVVRLADAAFLSEVAALPQYYIQNATPVALLMDLAKLSKSPQRILDLCASPGGKLLAAHDLFPQAELYANDISPDKMLRLEQNLAKYGVTAKVSCGKGEEYAAGQLFDIVILDVPCSNSGVLNKRHEARFRLTPEAIHALKAIQSALLAHAVKLIKDDGALWFMTCSILKEENEQLATECCRQHGLEIAYARTILPNAEGWDGGFACLLKKL